MLVADSLVYLELHKTGCTHIRNLLKEIVGGAFTGKHDKATQASLAGEKLKIGSIRDPWSWYLSLWSFGCDGKGIVHDNTTHAERVGLKGLGWKRTPFEAAATLRKSLRRARRARQWQAAYRDSADRAAFADWVRMMNDEDYIGDIGDGYGASGVGHVAGIMSYRFMSLFCETSEMTDARPSFRSYADFHRYVDQNCFIDFFIRTENLLPDLVEAVALSGRRLSDAQRQAILSSGRTNASSNRADLGFYDAGTAALVEQRERLIVERFGYKAPDTV